MSSPTGKRLALWAPLAALAGLLLSANAHAAPPPANTLIGNQASAQYIDPNGASQVATSNLVQTTVQQVGAFKLDAFTTGASNANVTKTGAAGTTVYAAHVLTNTGNGSDSFTITVTPAATNNFSQVAVYADANFDGLPDSTSALCTSTTGVCTVSPNQTVAGNNGQFGFVVAYSIPSTAATPATPYNTATITATAGTPALYTTTSVGDVDTVNLTNVAAFNLSKAISLPQSGVTAPGTGAWPAAAVSGKRSGATCPATLAGAQAPAAGCQYTTYTLTYSNTGGASGRFYMQDSIGTGATAGFTYVPGSAVWSNSPGTAMGEGSGGDPSGVDFLVSGTTMTFVDNTLPVNTTRSVSFIVLVNSTAAIGTSNTSNSATFDTIDAGSASTTAAPTSPVTATSNTAPFTVQGTYGIALGAAASTSSTATDTTAGTPNGSATAGADTTVVTTAAAGTMVSFTQVVYNTGNATDTVNINGVSPGTGGGTAFPAGTTFFYYKADGSTPLSDTNGDGTLDTGPIQASSQLNIVVKAKLPANAAAATAQVYTLTVTGTSVGDSTQVDATRDVLNAVTGTLVDLENGATYSTGSSDYGTGPSATATVTNTTPAGSVVAFPLTVANNDSGSLTYNLAASATSNFPGSLPAGWSVKFVTGNVASAACAATAAITTVTVGAGASAQYTACVTPPANQAAVTQDIYFQVRSAGNASTGAVVVDTVHDALTVTAANATTGTTLTPSNSGQVAPGGTVVFAHTLTNVGSASCNGTYTITATPSDANWTTSIYIDSNNNGVLDSGDTLVTGAQTVTLAASGTQKLLIKVFAPGGAMAGAAVSVPVAVTFTSGTCPSPASGTSDTVTVITGQIRLVKQQALDATCTTAGANGVTFSAAAISAAKPGQCIVYQVVATNEGSAAISNLMVSDAVPAYTSLSPAAAQPTTQCTATGLASGSTAVAYTGGAGASAVSCGSNVNSVQPGGTVTLTFSVQINQ